MLVNSDFILVGRLKLVNKDFTIVIGWLAPVNLTPLLFVGCAALVFVGDFFVQFVK